VVQYLGKPDYAFGTTNKVLYVYSYNPYLTTNKFYLLGELQRGRLVEMSITDGTIDYSKRFVSNGVNAAAD
jgi:hypothetical protein